MINLVEKLPIINKHILLKKTSIEQENKLNALTLKNNELTQKSTELENERNNLRLEKNLLKKEIFNLNLNRHKLIVENLIVKIKKNKRIRVCFLVMLDSSFSYKSLFEKMINDNIFDPFIVVIPDLSRGTEYMVSAYNKTYNSLSQKYQNIYHGYDFKNQKAIDFSKKTDIVCFQIPYSNMTDKVFEIEYYLDKPILTIYFNYGFFTLKFGREIIKLDFYSYLWKVFVENNYNIEELKKYQALEGKNAVASGYCKMDDLYKQKVIPRNEKTIIIAPHHTISDWKALQISNFLKYSDFFLRLPTIYPDINFIFRPHPLLIVQLKREGFWGEEKTNQYFQKMSSYPNVKYSEGGEYFDLFANSDAIIHDCGSFLAEYLFTEKPACYLLKNKKSIKKWFLPLGQKCLDHCYQAFSEKDILNFIDNVIVKAKDPLQTERIKFINSYLKINYPHASQFILDYLKKELTS